MWKVFEFGLTPLIQYLGRVKGAKPLPLTIPSNKKPLQKQGLFVTHFFSFHFLRSQIFHQPDRKDQ